MIQEVDTPEAPARGRPRTSSGRGFRKRAATPTQILISSEEAGSLAGISGQQWRHHAKTIPNFPQPRQWPPGSRRLAWVQSECVTYLQNLPVAEYPQ